mmetsp:Transcript_5751/g.13100  ORF Transcript_5751/g.13100 Transcript_5751/m.13100 type:complete len:398 (+) Transcript_5751:126-1319(+)|eukprot:CAMPEP_0172320800 /NCGR_PEP_ID=MMETSP1058-20130122/41468_1 /TAXON_ID=83371 /ORGANISM="Detonula confervacea, Strain CCMP 353" /LENGTH=397 /DNA_ID=CAMNT_0013036147 /DNA_START=98 /DNA_END=1291 /DNA_ORIENTATION=+
MPKVSKTPDGSLQKKPPSRPYPLPPIIPTTAKKRGRSKNAAPPPPSYPPPPPPPPPPVNNPYYCKFFEEYWKNYGQGYQAPPGSGASFSKLPPANPPVHGGPPPPTPRVPAAKIPDALMCTQGEYPVKTDRKTYILATPDDPNHLSEKQCYVRTRLAEIFVSDQSDIDKSIRGRRAGFVGQIGLRCVFCVPALESKDRVERARCYPTTTAKFYQTVQDMQHFHFNTCPAIPSWIREKYQSLGANMNNRRGGDKMSPKDYWAKCCADWGLVDHIGDNGNSAGVKLKDGHSLVERARLPEYARELFMPPYKQVGGDGMVVESQEENEDDGEMEQVLTKEVMVGEEKDNGGFDDLVADLDDNGKGGGDDEEEEEEDEVKSGDGEDGEEGKSGDDEDGESC